MVGYIKQSLTGLRKSILLFFTSDIRPSRFRTGGATFAAHTDGGEEMSCESWADRALAQTMSSALLFWIREWFVFTRIRADTFR